MLQLNGFMSHLSSADLVPCERTCLLDSDRQDGRDLGPACG